MEWIDSSVMMPTEKSLPGMKSLGISGASDNVIVTLDVDGQRIVGTACTMDGVWRGDKIRWFEAAGSKVTVPFWMPFPKPCGTEAKS